MSKEGLALKLEFSTRRSGVIIRWENTRRLKPGTMVALTPKKNPFKTKCVVAIVAGSCIEHNRSGKKRPTIPVWVEDLDQVEVDPLD